MTRQELVRKPGPKRQGSLSEEQLSKIFLDEVYRLPFGERINLCIQCGTCSGSCPTAYLMDYSPREIFAALRAGMLDRVLGSNTVWMCTSCYYCTVRCPQEIKITDIMYELKRLAIECDLFPRGERAPVMAGIFKNLVDQYGRNQEMNLMVRYYLRTGVGQMFKSATRGMALMRKGRMSLAIHKVKGMEQLRKILGVLEGYEAEMKKQTREAVR